MDHIQSVSDDLVEIAREKFERGLIDRRTLLAGLALFGALPAGSNVASAQGKQLVMINWGGDNTKWIDKVYLQPYTAKSGTKFVVDPSGPTAGKLRAIAESKNINWDVADSVPHTAFQLARFGYMDEIDYAVVDRNKVVPGFTYQHAVANGTFSNVLCVNKDKFRDRVPGNWADFWNVKDFPGKRTMWKGFNGVLEVALIADGVPLDKIYPIDVKRALDKVKQIKEHIIFWSSGSESQNLMRQGEVVLADMWSTRANFLRDETKGRIDYTFNQGVMVPGVWIVPKGNPAGKAVYDFIAFTQDPKLQVEMLIGYGYGPANPAAAGLVPAEYKDRNPASPENLAKQLLIKSEWYRDNYDEVYPKYLDVIG